MNTTKKSFASWIFLVFYILLIFIIILPYVKHAGNYLVGGDSGFFEESVSFSLQRAMYTWSDYDGAGGLSIGKFPNFLNFSFTNLLSLFLPIVLIQLIFLIFIYSIGFWGIYLLIRKFADKYYLKIDKLMISAVSLFYCTSLLTYSFLNSATYYSLIFYLATPLLLYSAWEFTERSEKKFLFLFLITSIINLPTFNNVALGIIQYLTLFIGLLVLTKKRRKVVLIFALFTLINASAIVEYLIFYFYSRDLMVSSSVNSYLVDKAFSSQRDFFSLDKLFSFYDLKLFGNWWYYVGLVSNFHYKELYSSVVYKIILAVPFMFILMLLLDKKNSKGPYPVLLLLCLLSFVSVSLLGFLPLVGVLGPLFSQFPVLGIFRNSQKFILPLMIFSSILLYAAVSKRKIFKVVFIIFLLLLNMYSITGFFFNEYSFGHLPQNYKNLNSDISNIVGKNNRCMIYPAEEFIWFGFNWNYTGYSPILSLQNRVSCFNKNSEVTSQANKNIYNIFKNPSNVSIEDWRKYDVKYVFIHKDINYAIFNQPDNFLHVNNTLDNQFTKVISNENFDVYQTFEGEIPLIDSTQNLTFEKINPVNYVIELEGMNKIQNVSFVGAYHTGWKIYIKKKPFSVGSLNSCNKSSDSNCSEIIFPPIGNELNYLWKLYEFDNTHKETESYFNQWTIDPQYIKDNYSKEYYTENPDGSINVELVMYFKPQSYFYLGVLISILTILSCFSYLVYETIKQQRLKGDY